MSAVQGIAAAAPARLRPASTAYSRDKRPDCVQVMIALIVTPDGFPLAYEAMPGNTADNITLAAFLEKIERQYGRSDRIWILDRGIPTKETLASMRERTTCTGTMERRNPAGCRLTGAWVEHTLSGQSEEVPSC